MKPSTRRDHEQRILRVMLHIQEHLDEELPLEELAQIACYSPYHFHRIFRSIAGESVASYLRRLRLERSAWQLVRVRYSITEIAFDAGFAATESFSRAFRKRFGMSPSAYREEHGYESGDDGFRLGEPQLPHSGKRGENMDVNIEQLDPITVLSVRHVGPYHDVGPSFEQLMQAAYQAGVVQTGGPMIGISYDDPDVTPQDKLRYDACLQVEGADFEAPQGAFVQEIKGGRYVVYTHEGSYAGLSESYSKLYAWMLEQGLEPTGDACLEVYLNSPEQCSEEELRTQLRVPIS